MLELLEKGACVSTRSRDGWTALHRAIWNGHGSIVKLLVARGADINAKDFNGESVLQQAAWRGQDDMVRFLIESRVDVNAKSNNGETALHWAASNGHNGVILLLIENGADIKAKSNCNETASEQAAEHKERTTVELLSRLEGTKVLPVQSETPRSNGGLTASPPQSQLNEDIDDIEGSPPLFFDDIEVVGKESADPAVLECLSLEPTATIVIPYGPPGFSKKAKISSVVGGVERTFFMKRLLDPNALDVFEGSSIRV